jgi:hypothetical protein
MAQSGGGAWSTLDVKFDVHLTRAALSGLPSTSDNISDGTWLTRISHAALIGPTLIV